MAVILLVEDDHIITAALTRSLTDAGHVVRPVSRRPTRCTSSPTTGRIW